MVEVCCIHGEDGAPEMPSKIIPDWPSVKFGNVPSALKCREFAARSIKIISWGLFCIVAALASPDAADSPAPLKA